MLQEEDRVDRQDDADDARGDYEQHEDGGAGPGSAQERAQFHPGRARCGVDCECGGESAGRRHRREARPRAEVSGHDRAGTGGGTGKSIVIPLS